VIPGLGRRRFDRPAADAGRADVLVAQMVFRDAQQIPLDFRADGAVITTIGKAAQRLAQ
jgi:hypothetical protein